MQSLAAVQQPVALLARRRQPEEDDKLLRREAHDRREKVQVSRAWLRQVE